jgi:hypothetical protein
MKYMVAVDGSSSAMHAFWWVLHHATPEDHVYLIHIYKVEGR